jgi:hypothetical protein
VPNDEHKPLTIQPPEHTNPTPETRPISYQDEAAFARIENDSTSGMTESTDNSVTSSATQDAPAQPVPAAPFSSSDQAEHPKPKNRRAKTAAIIIAAALAVLFAGGAAAYNLWYQNPDKVVGDALANMLQAETATIDGKSQFVTDGSTVDMTFSSVTDGKQAKANVTLKGELDEDTIELDVDLVSMTNKDLYLKFSKLRALMATFESNEETLPESVRNIVKLVDGQWIVITSKDLEPYTGTDDEATACVRDVLNRVSTDDTYQDELEDTYRRYPLIVVDSRLGSKDGNLGYEVSFSRENAVKYANALNLTQFYKDIRKCDDSIEALDGEKMFAKSDTESDTEAKLELWIDRWSHQLSSVKFTSSSDGSKVTVNLTTDFTKPVIIEEPKEAITLKELESRIEAALGDLMGGPMTAEGTDSSGPVDI